MLIPSRIHSPPAKKPKPLLLHAPGPDDEVSESNRFTYEPAGKYAHDRDHADFGQGGSEDEPVSTEQGAATSEADEDDDFAKMVSPLSC